MNTRPDPLVTCLILCYNHAKFVAQCLDRVRAQSYSNLELVIIDDHSKDNSVQVINDWLMSYDKPFVFLPHKSNTGVCRSINDGLSRAKGEFISMIAADDYWEENKISEQVQSLRNRPNDVGVLYSDVYRVDENARPLSPETYIHSHVPSWPPPEGDVLKPLWEIGNWIPPMGTLVRRECFQKVGTYDESLWNEDWDMWLRMAEHYKFVYSPRISASYRILSTSMVRSSWPRICESSVRMCLKHLARTDLPAGLRPLIKNQLSIWAKRCYRESTPQYKKHLFSALRLNPALDTAASFLFGASGIPFNRYTSLAARVRGRPGVAQKISPR